MGAEMESLVDMRGVCDACVGELVSSPPEGMALYSVHRLRSAVRCASCEVVTVRGLWVRFANAKGRAFLDSEFQ